MANNDSFNLMHGTLEENAVCPNYNENICKKYLKFAKMADVLEKLGFL